MESQTFKGDQKSGRWLLADLEQRFVARHVDRVPAWLETHHLTLLTVVWSGVVVLAGFLAATHDLRWLGLASLAIALQYLSDLFDGAVGRRRETGLVRWGYYMDHLLDFVFLGALFVALGLVLPTASTPWLIALFGIAGAFMVSSFLDFAATGEFKISHFGLGPTELRLALIAINQAIVTWGPGPLAAGLPLAVLGLAAALAAVACRTQRQLWQLDVKQRARTADGERVASGRSRSRGTRRPQAAREAQP